MKPEHKQTLKYWPERNEGWTVVRKEEIKYPDGPGIERVERIRTFGELKKAGMEQHFVFGFLDELEKTAKRRAKDDEPSYGRSALTGGIAGAIGGGAGMAIGAGAARHKKKVDTRRAKGRGWGTKPAGKGWRRARSPRTGAKAWRRHRMVPRTAKERLISALLAAPIGAAAGGAGGALGGLGSAAVSRLFGSSKKKEKK